LRLFGFRSDALADYFRPRWPIWLGLLVLFNGPIGGFLVMTPRLSASIAASEIVPELGKAYSFHVAPGASRLYELPSDTIKTPRRSRLQLFEQGRALFPSHAEHARIREAGGGSYSHWGDQVIFSTPDGSDPRSNGRTYTIASPMVVKSPLRLPLLAVLLLADVAFLVMFNKETVAFLRRRAHVLLGVLALATTAAAALSASGLFGTLVIAENGVPEDAALCLRAIEHACLGCLLSIAIWASGAGVTRLLYRRQNASLAEVLVPAFPVSLVLLAGMVATALLAPQGRTVALILWAACTLPLLGWRPPRRELVAALKACLAIIPFALAFGIWLALLWHGPTDTLPGSPSGDLTDYAGTIWSLADQPYPLPNFGYENAGPRPYFNSLYPALGATLLDLPGFDPLLYLLAGGGTSYILFSALMLQVYLTDRGPRSTGWLSVFILLLAFVVAARYPYWVVESIPVVFTPALTISVLWMTERSKTSFGWTIAAMAAGLIGSALSKIVSAAVLVPLGASGFWRQFRLFPNYIRIGALAIGAVFAIYCLALLWRFLPLFIGLTDYGPESLRNPAWWFRWRDIGTVALALLGWLIADVPVALALSVGFASFLLFSFLFQINFVCATIVLGLLAFTGPLKSGISRLVLLALATALPAAVLSDPAGVSSGLAWIMCVGGSVLVAILSTTRIEGTASLLTLRASAATAAATLVVTAFLLVGVANGRLIFSSGWPPLKPELRDVWAEVRRLTPHDSLVFTDQVDESINIVGGWNTYAYSSQRQIYISSYYTSFELRKNPDKLHALLADNAAVLNGSKKPSDVPIRSHYESMFAVISALKTVPAGWTKLYGNNDYAIFKIIP
jgi:hypothetical protein